MSISNTQGETITMKQVIFVGVLAVLGILLSALVLCYFSPGRATSGALPYQHPSPVVYEGSVQA
jgi:hypothetical protein